MNKTSSEQSGRKGSRHGNGSSNASSQRRSSNTKSGTDSVKRSGKEDREKKVAELIYDNAPNSAAQNEEFHDSHIFTYAQQMNKKTNQYDTFQYLVDKKTGKSESILPIQGLVSLTTISDNTVFAVVLRMESNYATVLGSCIIPSDYHLKITTVKPDLGQILIDDLVNVASRGKTQHTMRNSALCVPSKYQIPPSAIFIRLIRQNKKTKVYEGYETLFPDYSPNPITVSAVNGNYIINSVQFTQSHVAGVRSPLYPHVQFTPNGNYVIDGDIKTEIVEFPSDGFKSPCFIVTKFNAEAKLRVLEAVPYYGSETFVVDGINDKGKARTLDMFTIKDKKVLRQKSVNSSFTASNQLSFRPGMILILITEPNNDGMIQLLDTLFFGFKITNINLRYTMVDPNNGQMILLKTTEIPQSKLILLKKESRERLKKLSDPKSLPIDVSKPGKKRRRSSSSHHHHHHNEKSSKKKPEQPKQQPKVIQEYYYYSDDDEEEEEVEVRNITLYVDDDGNVISGDQGGKGQNLDDVLKKINKEQGGHIQVVEKDE